MICRYVKAKRSEEVDELYDSSASAPMMVGHVRTPEKHHKMKAGISGCRG